MKKIELINVIQDFLAGGDKSNAEVSRMHPEIIQKYIDMAFDKIVWEDYQMSEKKQDFSVLDSYLQSFKNVAVLYDSDRDEYYSVLPAPIGNIPLSRSVRLISPMKNQSYAFIYRANNSKTIYDELEVSAVETRPRFYIENDNVYYDNIQYPYISKVLVKMVATLSSLEDDEEVQMPLGTEYRIFDYVMQYLSKKLATPEDVNNDNSTKKI